MSQEVKVYCCPCCGEAAHWRKGDFSTRMLDCVQCLHCFLEMEGSYEPQSAVENWNCRVLEHEVKDSVYDINGNKIK